MTPRSIRRAAERKRMKLERKMQRSPAMAARHDEAALLSEPKIQADEPAERKALKLARKAEKTMLHTVNTDPAPAPISEAQLAANRANAQLSTGPKSPEGNAKISLNAVKTALTGRTVLLPSDDAAEYQRFLQAYEQEFQPVGQRERDLVQSIADTWWRLRRIPGLEMAIFAHGRIHFAGEFNDHDPSLRPGMIEFQIFMTYEKQLRNLHLQEARLSRRREKETAELRQLQQERKTKEQQALDAAARHYLLARRDDKSFDPAENGFEFSIAQIERYLDGCSEAWISRVLATPGKEPAKTLTEAA